MGSMSAPLCADVAIAWSKPHLSMLHCILAAFAAPELRGVIRAVSALEFFLPWSLAHGFMYQQDSGHSAQDDYKSLLFGHAHHDAKQVLVKSFERSSCAEDLCCRQPI